MILMPCGFDLAHTVALGADVTARPGFDALPCATGDRVLAVDGSAYFNRPGPRITRGLEILAEAIHAHPGDPAPAGAAYWNQPETSVSIASAALASVPFFRGTSIMGETTRERK